MVINRVRLLIQAIKSCHYQQDLSLESVGRYMSTFDYLMANEITFDTLYWAGTGISGKNDGWRKIPAVIKNRPLLHHTLINRALTNLVSMQSQLTPEEIFVEFEVIHPYNDGNGRVGEILYYKLTGSFDVPKFYLSTTGESV